MHRPEHRLTLSLTVFEMTPPLCAQIYGRMNDDYGAAGHHFWKATLTHECIYSHTSPAIIRKCPCMPTYTHAHTYSHKAFKAAHTKCGILYSYVKECWFIFVKWYYRAPNSFFFCWIADFLKSSIKDQRYRLWKVTVSDSEQSYWTYRYHMCRKILWSNHTAGHFAPFLSRKQDLIQETYT